MSEMYWLIVICNTSLFIHALLIFAIICFGIFGIIALGSYFCSNLDPQSDEWIFNIRKKLKSITIVVSVLGILSCVIPTPRQMYAIIGIGGTIDYLQSNEKAKQLPDKVIDALDKWITLQEEDSKEQNE